MKTILFPTDFSDASENAFSYALHLAEQLDAWIILLHVHHPHRADTALIPEGMLHALEVEEEALALDHLKAYEQAVQASSGKNIKVIHKLDFGLPREQILNVSREVEPDILVMGTTGAGNVLNRLIGSVTAHVIQYAHCPVLAVPLEARFRPLSKFAYATNFEEEELAVLDRFQAFVRLLKGEISCVHVRQQQKGWDLLQLESFNEFFLSKFDSNEMEFYLRDCPNVIDGLNQFVADNDIDVLAMLTHRRDLLKRLFRYSYARKMVLSTHIPLLTFQKETVQQLTN